MRPGFGVFFDAPGLGAVRVYVRSGSLLIWCEGAVELVELRSTPLHLGGSRFDFLCPDCNRGAAKLYRLGGRFACRRCHGLTYLTQSVGRIERLGIGIRRLESQLGPEGARPPGMRWKRYLRLLEWSTERRRRQIGDARELLTSIERRIEKRTGAVQGAGIGSAGSPEASVPFDPFARFDR